MIYHFYLMYIFSNDELFVASTQLLS